ncbi:hypothetical protein OG21DRAFT_1426987 [Imleria badia]|nr:hypothetical protein OG21DRAFT_1426987 [Imleria badia]
MDTYEGCSEAFPGGKTFMDTFRDDQYANERQQNLYFPFALHKEWMFASWLLCLGISLTAIDSLLLLDSLQDIYLSFHAGKQLCARAEVLPSGPTWLYEELMPEGPIKNSVQLFYHRPIECLQSLLSHPLLSQHIFFVPHKIWTSAAKICCIYDEWLSGDRAWNI